jgi:hypothetical protein
MGRAMCDLPEEDLAEYRLWREVGLTRAEGVRPRRRIARPERDPLVARPEPVPSQA